MNRRTFFCSLVSVYLLANGTALGQKGCEFNIVGTWKVEIPGQSTPRFYKFSEDGTVSVLNGATSNMKEIASATYKLDYPKAPKAISFQATKAGEVFADGTTSMAITGYDDMSFTGKGQGSEPTRWVKVDGSRYFLVLAGSSEVFYDRSGPTFPMFIKMDGHHQPQVNALGIYSFKGKAAFGPVPADAYKEFMKEPRRASDVMLRLEITSAQYERGMKIMQMWERRVREDALLYPDIALDNVLLVKEVADSLNQCGQKVDLYHLDWGYEDKISDGTPPPHIPFLFFKEMRRRNESLHIGDDKFQGYLRPQAQPKGK